MRLLVSLDRAPVWKRLAPFVVCPSCKESSMNSYGTGHEDLHFEHLIIAHASKHGLHLRMPINILYIARQLHVSPRLRCRTYTDDGGVFVKYIERLYR